MTEYSVSASRGPVAPDHDGRTSTPKNVEPSLTARNEVIKACPDVAAAVNDFFRPAIERYNAKQTRSDRKKSYDYYNGLLSGESILGTAKGKPLSFRPAETELKLGNVLRAKLYSVFASLRIGHDLLKTLNVGCNIMTAHGGYFKSATGLQIASDALKIPVYAYPEAGEGGAWGMALLALYAARYSSYSLGDFLSEKIFSANFTPSAAFPTKEGSSGFDGFMARYKEFLPYVKSIVTK